MSRRRRCAVLVGGALLVVGACGGGGGADRDAAGTSTTAATSGGDYGATEVTIVDRAIAERFGPAVERLGLRITRAARYGKLGDTTPTPDGTHLAVYVEPTGTVSDADYVARIQPLADAFLPEVFEEVPNLASFDVCQEPPPGVDDAVEPKPYTQLLATREQAAAIDWPSTPLVDLVAASVDHPNRLGLGAREPVASSPEWRDVYAAASRKADEPAE